MSATIHRLPGRLIAFSLAIAALWAAYPIPARGDDEIQYFDRQAKAIVLVTANIEQESATGLRYRVGARGEAIDVPAQDLVDVSYAVPGSLRLLLVKARNEEIRSSAASSSPADRMAAIAQAIKEYQALLNDVPATSLLSARRHWRFRIARLKAHAAIEDPARAKEAEESLTSFLRENDSWQAQPTVNLLARVLSNKGESDRVGQIVPQWVNDKRVPAGFQRELMRETIFWAILAKNFKQASSALAAEKRQSPPGSADAIRLAALEALREAADEKPEKALAELDGLEKNAKEGPDRSFIWMIRGYCELLAGRNDRAMLAFLRLDQIQNEDQFAHARAVEELIRLFETRSDWSRAPIYRNKLWRDFAG